MALRRMRYSGRSATASSARLGPLISSKIRPVSASRAAAELQQRRRVRRRFMRQIDADEVADCLAVVDRVLDAFVRQAEALLCHIDAQRSLQAHGRASAPISLRVVRQERRNQRRPRCHGLDLDQKAVAPRLLIVVRELGVGKARLLEKTALRRFHRLPLICLTILMDPGQAVAQ